MATLAATFGFPLYQFFEKNSVNYNRLLLALRGPLIDFYDNLNQCVASID
jgi:hypothetical protein